MTTPSARFDLSGWKITLPIDSSGRFSGNALEVTNLRNYERSPYFYDDATGAMVFNAPVEGATTSGSSYARSELREMNGTALARWDLSTGGYMSATLEVDQVPTLSNGSGGRVIVGQIHGQDEELVRLYWHNNTLYFQNDHAGPNNREMRFDLKDSSGRSPDVSLNEEFAYSIEAKGENLVVKVYADGKEYASTSKINDVWDNDAFYFKAGMYLGVNESQGTGAGQVSFHSLSYNHNGMTALPTSPVNPPPSPTNPDDPTTPPPDTNLPATARTFVGKSSADNISGTAGNDLVDAKGGDDKIWAKGGSDVIWTGDGKDSITFDTALTSVDWVMDFNPERDTFRLNDRVFSEIESGQLSASQFRTGTRAMDRDDRIIYDRASGALWYDPDGSGAQAQVQFAWIENKANLTHVDFLGV